MQFPQIPDNEAQRLDALHSYKVLDTLPEKDFDELTKIASTVCGTPISLITLVDTERQWFKSAFGLAVKETKRDLAFCAHTINTPHEAFIVPDATLDVRFHDNPLVVGGPRVIFYAGIPLNSPDGYSLGTLCVIDHQPKQISQAQIEALQALANQVVGQLELRKKNRELEHYNREFSIINRNLSEFSYRVSHDLKTPLRGITNLSEWLLEEHAANLNQEGAHYLSLIHSRSLQLHNLIDGILQYSRASSIRVSFSEEVDLTVLLEEVLDHCGLPSHFTATYPKDHPTVTTFRIGLYQILQNLIANAIKYNDKVQGRLSVDFQPQAHGFSLAVTDNGPGIPLAYREKVFHLFETLGTKAELADGSVGVGLATVKSLTERMHGTIQIIDTPQDEPGTCFLLQFQLQP
ncbi:GAF domain-containing sensor histidine kinase [Rufibacter sp. LB8]|uniref:GAF domain-containing sensor histidine kinase n=1 Tax=Rufibacter sp. LB8 TaxID=2777781 RepID=UPI00178C65AA|nr:GAF domain-containing sensor histidine kinase [Rufibacter sp. LB8]